MTRLKILSLHRFIGTGTTKRSLPKSVLKPIDSNVLVDSFAIGVSAVKAWNNQAQEALHHNG